MRVLQARFVEVLQDQLKQDQQMAELQTQLQGSRKEVEAGEHRYKWWLWNAECEAGPCSWQLDRLL